MKKQNEIFHPNSYNISPSGAYIFFKLVHKGMGEVHLKVGLKISPKVSIVFFVKTSKCCPRFLTLQRINLF